MSTPKYNIEYETKYKSLLNDYTKYNIICYINDGDNILDSVWKTIITKTKTDNAKAIYDIIGIYKLPSCSACKNGALSQEAHMDCPDGCLHDSNNCEDCNN